MKNTISYHYELLKDLPGLKAGAEFTSDGYEDNFNILTFKCNDKFYSFHEKEIKDYPDWFKKVENEFYKYCQIKTKLTLVITNEENSKSLTIKGFVEYFPHGKSINATLYDIEIIK